MVSCPGCGAVVGGGDRYCASCGSLLPHAPVPAGDANVPAARSPVTVGAGPARPGPQRRRVSVLFCDLVGYTGLADGKDPEETRELLSGYFDLARAVVGRYGGQVEKFIGDAVMAVWGAPVAHEDDAERAVRAGLDLVDGVADYGSRHQPGLQARVGIASGPVATIETAEEGLVVGDRVNLAARVQTTASPGACVVDEVTRRLAEAAIAFEDAGVHLLKGLDEPVRLHRALRVTSRLGGTRRSSELEAPLVGREAELRALRELFHASAERRSVRLVVVSGPAGVGKSRIGWELEKYVDGLVETVLWHRGRCLSYGEGVTFWALAEMVRQRLSITEEDPPEVAASKLAEGIERLVPEEDRAYVGPRVGRLLGVGDVSATGLGRAELFAGWRLLFERLAATSPVVAVVEDAQHADEGLIDFLEHLVDWVRDLPVFVLVLARPELLERRPGLGIGRNRTVLSLDPLDPSSLGHLVDALLPGLPGAARRAIGARAEGIPLFAVETVRSLVDTGVVVPAEGGAFRVAGSLDALAVPETLYALLSARLDTLDARARGLVGVAAVLGGSFPAGALVAVSGREEDEVAEVLAELVRRDVLIVSADPLSPRQAEYRFAQNLLRQVAYETLPRRERKLRHLAVAAHLRSVFSEDGEEVAEVVSRHYLDALGAEPDDPDAEGLRDEALTFLERAAERAETTAAPGRAADTYASAARLLAGRRSGGQAAPAAPGPEPRRRSAGLWERSARAAMVAGDYDAAVVAASEATEAYRGAGDERAAAGASVRSGEALRLAFRHDEARLVLTGALEALRSEPAADTVECLVALAALEAFAGHLAAAERPALEALRLAQDLGVADSLLADVLITAGIIAGFTNRRAESSALFWEAARLARRAGDATKEGRALLNAAHILAGWDDAGSAEAARAAVSVSRRVGFQVGVLYGATNLIDPLLGTGEWVEARSVLAEAELSGIAGQAPLSEVRAIVDSLSAPSADAPSADAPSAHAPVGAGGPGERFEGPAGNRMQGPPGDHIVQDQATADLAAALRCAAGGDRAGALRVALAVVGSAGDLGYTHFTVRWAWPLAARLASELGERETLDLLLEGIGSVPSGHLPPVLRAERDLARARRAAAAGDPDADEGFARALAGLRRAGSPYNLAGGLVDHAEWLASGHRADGAAVSAAEAREIAERLGCRSLAARAERLAPRTAPVAGPADAVTSGATDVAAASPAAAGPAQRPSAVR